MDNFCNIEYLSERLAAVCKERDLLKEDNRRLQDAYNAMFNDLVATRAICERQAVMSGKAAALALELDDAKAEIARLEKENFWLSKGEK